MVDYAIDIRKQLYPKEEVPEVGCQICVNKIILNQNAF